MDNKIIILLLIGIVFISGCAPEEPQHEQDSAPVINEELVEEEIEEEEITEPVEEDIQEQKQQDEEMQEQFVEEPEEPYITGPARETKPAFPVQFTHHVIDLSHYQRLFPPGGVSLGTFNVFGGLTLKKDVERSPIYAPIDADVAGISYYSYSDPWTPETKMYDLSLIIHEDLTLSFGGLGELAPKLKAVAPQQPQEHSAGGDLTEPTSIKAGELLGYVVRVGNEGGWELGAYDKSNQNIVANMDRHWDKWSDAPGKYVIGVCPYNYYPDDMRQEYLNLMPGKKCPNASRDVPGTAAGYWFANKTFHTVEDDFFYFGGISPRLTIAAEESGDVVWGGFGQGKDEANVGTSPRDPADLHVGDSFCYKNDFDWVDTGKNYLFVKLLSETELAMYYGEGNCPSSLPSDYKVYLR